MLLPEIQAYKEAARVIVAELISSDDVKEPGAQDCSHLLAELTAANNLVKMAIKDTRSRLPSKPWD